MDGFVDISVSLEPVTMTDSYKQKSDEAAMQTCCQILPLTANVVAIYIDILVKKDAQILALITLSIPVFHITRSLKKLAN